MKRNWEALVLRAFGGRDFRLTVLDARSVGEHCRRLLVADGGLLAACGVHPTMWVRLWFEDGGKGHQRAYTLVDPDPAAGRFGLEFALHDGRAADWARAAAPGDTIDATVQGSAFAWPEPAPGHVYVIGDAASLPAVNSLLDSLAAAVPATVWLEYAHDGERDLPVRRRAHDAVTWVPRGDGGALAETVRAGLGTGPDAYYWIAAEAAATRGLARHVRRELGVDRHRLCALGYWSA
ncbi:siderophore-interacting protein [Dactylosporangium sp. CA-139066]|uniref:siderophore-interacting protein n=1 Tax=Dactylosporangium sp. CA-139066 TaxID=3239930 RepID=UPI003D8B72AC